MIRALFTLLLTATLTYAATNPIDLANLHNDQIPDGYVIWSGGPGRAPYWGPLLRSRLYAELGTPETGIIFFCTDCSATDPCEGGGTGNLAAAIGTGEGVHWSCGSTATTTTTTVTTTTEESTTTTESSTTTTT